MIKAGLKPGGVLIFESFIDDKREDYCLKRNNYYSSFNDKSTGNYTNLPQAS